MKRDMRAPLGPWWAAVLLLSCGGSANPSCPNDLPATCPSPAPSYRGTIDPILGAHCRACHAPGGQQSAIPLTTHEQVFASRGAVLNQVYACKMPPAGSPGPTSAERADLLAWLVCGAPDN